MADLTGEHSSQANWKLTDLHFLTLLGLNTADTMGTELSN
jgi:hypothetical protein